MKTIKKINLLLIGSIVLLGSCSTAYRSVQTPDDVYYSPSIQRNDSYAVTDRNQSKADYDDGDDYYVDNGDRGTYYSADDEERDIRRAINDVRYRTSIRLNMGFGYSPYGYSSFGYPYGGFGYTSMYYDPFSYGYMFNPFLYSNRYFSPYYNPFYSPFYSYYNPWYYGGYGGHYYGGGKGNYYGGRNNINSGARRYNLGNVTNDKNNGTRFGNTGSSVNRSNGSVPVRSFDRNSNVNTTDRRESSMGNSNVRRILPSTQRPTNSTMERRSAGQTNRETRPVQRESRPIQRESRPVQRESRPVQESRSMQPQRTERTFSVPERSTSSGSNNSSTPVRTFRRG